ncbi:MULTISPECIES: metal-binding protein [Calothrix]|uniref:Metal-binding protein n=2 Tax=Calothrix TaxID=1186 RepID=A0ABR8ANY0_9CYAN|nr:MULTISPECIES: metal-binding protein [Calothrix]MBD2200396.1 metal-binding protein [Calothrix parietina FACHB-288]MBD2229407.1 metal-binding protein [Calothrix anomala FACHB-343]
MPSGRTHDSITLYALPFVAGVTFWQTGSSNVTLFVAGGFLFGGLMFGPDLDIYSIQYQRWGFLRWIWLPYQKSLRHRSFLSHGPIIGTTLRVVYLSCLIAIAAIFILIIAEKLGNIVFSWQHVGSTVKRSLTSYSTEFLALFLGMELGAMSHSLSDWGNSAYKRVKKQGIQALLPSGKMKKRKPYRAGGQGAGGRGTRGTGGTRRTRKTNDK